MCVYISDDLYSELLKKNQIIQSGSLSVAGFCGSGWSMKNLSSCLTCLPKFLRIYALLLFCL